MSHTNAHETSAHGHAVRFLTPLALVLVVLAVSPAGVAEHGGELSNNADAQAHNRTGMVAAFTLQDPTWTATDTVEPALSIAADPIGITDVGGDGRQFQKRDLNASWTVRPYIGDDAKVGGSGDFNSGSTSGAEYDDTRTTSNPELAPCRNLVTNCTTTGSSNHSFAAVLGLTEQSSFGDTLFFEPAGPDLEFFLDDNNNEARCVYRGVNNNNDFQEINIDPDNVEALMMRFDASTNTLVCRVATSIEDANWQLVADFQGPEDPAMNLDMKFAGQPNDLYHFSLLNRFSSFGEMEQQVRRPFLTLSTRAEFTATCDFFTCTFNASESSGGADDVTSFDWEFGDGTTGTGETVTHEYDSASTFTVNLTVTNTTGDTDTTSDTVTTTTFQAEGGNNADQPLRNWSERAVVQYSMDNDTWVAPQEVENVGELQTGDLNVNNGGVTRFDPEPDDCCDAYTGDSHRIWAENSTNANGRYNVNDWYSPGDDFTVILHLNATEAKSGSTFGSEFFNPDSIQDGPMINGEDANYRCEFSGETADGHNGNLAGPDQTSLLGTGGRTQTRFILWQYDASENRGRCGYWNSTADDIRIPPEEGNFTVSSDPGTRAGDGIVGRGDIEIRWSHILIFDEFIHDPDRIEFIAENPYQAAYTTSFTVDCSNLTCTFNSTSTTGDGDFLTEHDWTFGDGTSNTGNNASKVTHTYNSTAVFDVSLTTENSTGVPQTSTQSVDVAFTLNTTHSTTTALEEGRAVATSWDFDPRVWVIDPRDTIGDHQEQGRALRFSEKLDTLQFNRVLCQGEGIRDPAGPGTPTGTSDGEGLAVTKDPGGRPVWVCEEASDETQPQEWFLQKANQTGVAQGLLRIFETDFDPAYAELDARTLNEVAWDGHGRIGLADMRNLFETVEFASDDATDVAIDPVQDDGQVFCITGLGTACLDEDGNVIGQRSNLDGRDIEVYNDTVYLITRGQTPRDIVRMSPELVEFNRTPADGALFPFEVSKTGRFLAHGNDSGTLGDPRNDITIRFASNGTKFSETADSWEMTNLESLAWHPRDEGIYALNDTRLDFLNASFVTESTSPEESESTKEDETKVSNDEGESAAGVGGAGGGGDTSFSDTENTGNALGVSAQGAGLFLSIFLILGFAFTGALTTRPAGEAASLTVGSVAAFGGTLLAFAFGWFPVWGVFAIVLIIGVVLLRRFMGGGG